MAAVKALSADELISAVQLKIVQGALVMAWQLGRISDFDGILRSCNAAGLDVKKYARQVKDIVSLFDSSQSKIELIESGPRAGSWEMKCYFKGIRHCFHSAKEVRPVTTALMKLVECGLRSWSQ